MEKLGGSAKPVQVCSAHGLSDPKLVILYKIGDGVMLGFWKQWYIAGVGRAIFSTMRDVLMLTYPKTSRKWETYTFTHLVPPFKTATLQNQKPLFAHAIKLPPSAVQLHGVVIL